MAVPLGRVLAHLVLEPQPSLIDCGYARSRGRIEEGNERAWPRSRRAGTGRLHARSPRPCRRRPRAGVGRHPVLIHPADGERLAITWRDMLRPTRGKFFAAMTPEPPATIPIEDGDVLPMLGGLRVVHTPGHTPEACASTVRVTASSSWAIPSSAASVACRSRAASTATTSAWRAVPCNVSPSLDVGTVVFSHYPPLTRARPTLSRASRVASTNRHEQVPRPWRP